MNLHGFPRRTLRGDRTVYRIHKSGKRPWWFFSNGEGRFDPVGTAMGACYMAQRPLGSWVEVFRKTMLIAESEVDARELQAVTMGRDLRLANITSQRALGFGVTGSLGADQQYSESQAFAAEAAQAGYHGVLYFVRHDPAQSLYGIALFGPAGQADPADPLWPCNSGPIPDALVQDAKDHFGYRVLPEP